MANWGVAEPTSSLSVRTMSTASSSSSSVASCCSCCLIDVRAIIMEVISSPSNPVTSWIWTRAVFSYFALVPKQYGRTDGLKVSLPYITFRTLILMITKAESGPGMPFNHWASVLTICQSSVSLLPALFRFFFEGSANPSMALKPNPQSSGLGISSSSLSSSEGSVSSVERSPSWSEPYSLLQE